MAIAQISAICWFPILQTTICLSSYRLLPTTVKLKASLMISMTVSCFKTPQSTSTRIWGNGLGSIAQNSAFSKLLVKHQWGQKSFHYHSGLIIASVFLGRRLRQRLTTQTSFMEVRTSRVTTFSSPMQKKTLGNGLVCVTTILLSILPCMLRW